MDYSSEDIKNIVKALTTIKNVCAESSTCEDCPFMKRGGCYIKHVDPQDWEINSSYIWRAFK